MKNFCKPFVTVFAVCFILSCFTSCKEIIPVINVDGVTLDKSDATIKKDETITLTATITPENADNKEVSWSSTNENIVVEADGLTANVTVTENVKDGDETTITVKTADGGFEASCKITVKIESAKEEEPNPDPTTPPDTDTPEDSQSTNDDNSNTPDQKPETKPDPKPEIKPEHKPENDPEPEIPATLSDAAEKILALKDSPIGTYTVKATGELKDTADIKFALKTLGNNNSGVLVDLD